MTDGGPTVSRRMAVLLIIAAFVAGWVAHRDPNATLTYNEFGDPKNCRAIIQMNLDGWRGPGWHGHRWTAEDALDHIERNCGRAGYSWGR